MYARSNEIVWPDDLLGLIDSFLSLGREDFVSLKQKVKRNFLDLEDVIYEMALRDPLSKCTLVSKYQVNVTELLETVWSGLQKEKKSRDLKDTGNYRVAVYYYTLNRGIIFLERLYQFYPDQFQDARPLCSFIPFLRQKTYLNRFFLLMETLKENRVDRLLIITLENYFLGFLDSTVISYFKWQHWFYAFRLVSELPARLIHLKHSQRYEQELIEQLVTHNFNFSPFYHFLTGKMQKSIDGLEEDAGKEDQWISYLNMFSAIPMMRKLAADSDIPSIKHEIIKYIKIKKREYSKIRKLWFRFPLGVIDPKTGRYHFKVAFTVPQLLFFFRVLMETEMLFVQTKKKLFHFINDFIGTDKAGIISLRSLHSKNTLPSQKTINKVRECLLEIIDYINSKYQ
ncbi:hypothetical protein [Olivibacter jilunii]|uniref:hypothetical protein n=1 Tax=Olivibacter jilunii TaxID=985016 RepID=UPI0010316621|nr:hypothetical protein [Olivibacter jilunii]